MAILIANRTWGRSNVGWPIIRRLFVQREGVMTGVNEKESIESHEQENRKL